MLVCVCVWCLEWSDPAAGCEAGTRHQDLQRHYGPQIAPALAQPPMEGGVNRKFISDQLSLLSYYLLPTYQFNIVTEVFTVDLKTLSNEEKSRKVK